MSYLQDLHISDDLTFTIRLANGSDTAGRVEVKVNGKWGTVCGLDLTHNEAKVMCVELGFHDGRVLEAGQYGGGSGQVLLTRLACDGKLNTLFSGGKLYL